MTPELAFLLFAAALAGAVAWILREPLAHAWRRHRLGARPFPAAWRPVLRRHVPALRALPANLQLRLKRRIPLFLAEVPIIGCAGLEVDDEMRVTIAALACLPTLGRGSDALSDLKQVLLYPGPFLVQQRSVDGAGLVHEDHSVRAGESWVQGQVVLSWDDVLAGAAEPDDGRNVVIHEIAHQLDGDDGSMNGTPRLRGPRAARRWAAVMEPAFQALCERAAAGVPGLLDPYGATNRAEFFAVISELFFERPQALASTHPAVFEELRRYYRLDPLSW
jgi:MtfA peptidase